MEYTEITEDIINERDRAVRAIITGAPVRTPDNKPQFANKKGKPLHTGNSITYFARHFLGVRAYAWQHLFWEYVLENKKDVIACTPRQVGKSFAVAVAALHAATLNLYPVESKGNKTIIGIVSKSLDQSKHLMKGIRELMYMGDAYLNKNHPEFENYFTNRLSRMRVDTNNKTSITLREPVMNDKGEWEARGEVIGEIVCIPPTDSARGYTFSKLFMDEAAFFENQEFFSTIAEPTLRATGGHSVVTTTPHGQKGWFFESFDPFDEIYDGKHPSHRLWLHWKHIENEEEREAVLRKKVRAEKEGRERKFQQEYEASFTDDATAFFDPSKVDGMFDSAMAPWDAYLKPTDMGVDIGFKTSRTVITISRLGDDGIIRRVYHKKYPESDDLPIINDIKSLIPLFNVQRVIVDDCPAATAVLQTLKRDGINVKLMNFKTDKTRKYVQFKAKMYQGLIKSYKDRELSSEMKGIVETEGVRMTRIEKLKNGTDDMIDSFVISSYFYVEEKKGLKIYDWDDI